MDTTLLWIAVVGAWILPLALYWKWEVDRADGVDLLLSKIDLLEKNLSSLKENLSYDDREINRRLDELESDIEDLEDLRRMIGHFAKVIQDIARWSLRLERD